MEVDSGGSESSPEVSKGLSQSSQHSAPYGEWFATY